MKQWERRVLSVLALGGSFLALVLIAGVWVSPGSFLAKAFMLPFVLLYLWGIWCGIRMLEDGGGAIRSNMWFWAAQIPYLTSPVIGYFFSSGLLFFVTFAPKTSSFGYLYRFGSQFEYSLFQADKPFVLGVNILAVGIVIWLAFMLRVTPPNNSFKPSPLLRDGGN